MYVDTHLECKDVLHSEKRINTLIIIIMANRGSLVSEAVGKGMCNSVVLNHAKGGGGGKGTTVGCNCMTVLPD